MKDNESEKLKEDSENSEKGIMQKAQVLLPVVIVLGIGAIVWSLSDKGIKGKAEAEAIEAPPKLSLGKAYYVCVKLVEANHVKENEKGWDNDSSGPDLQYEMIWKENKIFTSSERKNSLIGTWPPLSPDVWKILTGGQVNLATVIQAGVIQAESNSKLKINVYDKDIVGKELVGSLDLEPAKDLVEGSNEISDTNSGINRIELLTIRTDQSDAEILQQIGFEK